MKVCGIYQVKNKANGKAYIGKSVDVARRLKKHKSALEKNKHINKHLQNGYNKYGDDSFEFVLVERCEESDLANREQHWINEQLVVGVYNVDLDVMNHVNGFIHRKHLPEVRQRMSDAKKGLYDGDRNPNFGKKQSTDTRKLMSLNRGGLSEDDVKSIVKMLLEKKPHQEIADIFQIGRTMVTRISNGTRYANITGGPVVPVMYVDGKRSFNESHRQRIGDSHKGMKYNTKKVK